MSPPVFWRASLGEPGATTVLLDGPEGHHAAVVRRIGRGERLRVTDGCGSYVEGPVVAVGKRHIEVAVEERVTVPVPAPRLTVVQAVPKGERAELAVQALVEVGVDRVVPWAAERSQVRVSGERGLRVAARWRGWAQEAGKQARRTWFCEVADVASTAEVAALAAAADVGLVLHEDVREPLAGVEPPPAGEVLLVVGPEGGISPAELAALGVEATSSSGSGDPAVPPAGGGDPIVPAAGGGDPGIPASSGSFGGSTRRTNPSNAPLGAASGGPRAVRLGDTVLRTSTAGAVAAAVVLAATRWR